MLRVILVIDGRVGKLRPRGQDASSRTVSSSTIRSYTDSRRPWKGGISSRRCALCSLPRKANSEPGPSIRPRLRSRLSTTSAGVRNSCRTSAGSLMTTARPKIGTFTVKASPYFSRICRTPRLGRLSA